MNSRCPGPCPAVSWASPKNASPRMKLSLSQGCTTHPVDFFPPYVQLAPALLQISAAVFWLFPEHFGDPGWMWSITRPQGVKDSHHPSLPVYVPVQTGYHPFGGPVMPVALTGSSLSQTLKETAGSGVHQKLLQLKILGSTFLFLTLRVFGYQNVSLCHPCCLACRCLQSLGYWLLHLSSLSKCPSNVFKEVVERMENMAN